MARPSVTTTYYLEMVDPRELSPKESPEGFAVSRVWPPAPELNRQFYVAVGRDWSWTDRLNWSIDDWNQYARRVALQTWIGYFDGQPAGYFELESQPHGNVEIAYFGLLPDFIGHGLGGALLTAAVECAWSTPNTRRVWLHTCNEDHQHALNNYRSRGFRLYKTERC